MEIDVIASGSVSVTNPSVGPTGATAPTSANEIAGVDSGGVLRAINVDTSGNLAALPLPTGAATSANQSTELTRLGDVTEAVPASDTASSGLNGRLQRIAQRLTSLIALFPGLGQKTMAGSMSVVVASDQTVPVSGAFYQATQPVSAAALPLPAGASTSALQTTGNTSVASIDTKTPALGQAAMAASVPVTLASDQTTVNCALPDITFTGQSAQTTAVNNIIPVASSANATSVAGYRSGSIQVVSSGTGGAFIFEGSNDNINFKTIPVFDQFDVAGTPVIAAISATSSQTIYTFPIQCNYIRLRISTTITGGSIQAFSRFSQSSWMPSTTQVANFTPARLNATVSGSLTGVTTVTNVTTLASVTAAHLGAPTLVADVASGAITTTTTTAAFTPGSGPGYMVQIPVTAVSGTNPTMSVAIQESADATNWYTVYTFPTITATGSYSSPVLTLSGFKVRYVQTIAGTTPSFTRAINRLESSQSSNLVPSATVYTDRSGTTSGTPSTSTTVASANQSRRYFIIQNLSTTATIYINFTAAATTTNSLALGPLGAYVMEASSITTEQINVLSTVASVAYAAKEG